MMDSTNNTKTSYNTLPPEIVQMILSFALGGTRPYFTIVDNRLVSAIESGALHVLDNFTRAQLLVGFTTYKFSDMSAMETALALSVLNKTTRSQLPSALHKKADMVEHYTNRTLKRNLSRLAVEASRSRIESFMFQEYGLQGANGSDPSVEELRHQMSTSSIWKGYLATVEIAWYRRLANKIETELL